MLQKRRSFGTRKVSPPQPTCMSDDQKATYLSNLRNNRPARPGGARPFPGRKTVIESGDGQYVTRSGSTISFQEEQREDGNKRYSITNSNSMPLLGSMKGRPLAQPPTLRSQNDPIPQRPGELSYRELTSRELEKQEAHSLREALEEIDHADEESRVFEAAQKEAAELVWKHLNPKLAEHEKTSAYKNPDWTKDNKRTDLKEKDDARRDQVKSISDRMAELEACKVDGLKIAKRGSNETSKQGLHMHSNRRKSSGKRNVSNGSNKGVFRNPEDQIYEEPEELRDPIPEAIQELPLQSRPRNALPRGSRPLPDKNFSTPLPERPKFDRFEIYKNPPTQSRRADYTANPPSRESTPEVEIPKGRAMEIRSDEIRAATSMKRKDRSPKLPTPTAVSDRPGRPIVSFDPSWRPHESPKTSMDVERPSTKSTLSTTQSAPAVPTINLPVDDITIQVNNEDLPSISVSTPPVPTINLPGDELPSIQINAAPQPQINSNEKSTRPLPHHTQSLPAKMSSGPKTRVPWLSRGPTTSSATVTCNSCQLPISGRIVTASGASPDGPKARFHPECFTCFHCSTKLECISFYPEPEAAREERLQQEADVDPDEMRFYCHLDFHDLFSPRCASCKTPIEGAVILAAGKSWHEGHFFCAECGDPFSSTSPFVEDKGYAYCVGCHTKRTSARCRSCKKQILEETFVEALGGKWHEDCFRCDDCAGDFGEEGRFFVREVEVELTDKEKRRGMSKKFEDRAVCHRCEELRLRRIDAFL